MALLTFEALDFIIQPKEKYGGNLYMKKAPCLGCEDRELGCHAHCQSYIEWTKRKDEIKAVDRRERDVARALNAIKEAGIKASRKEIKK